MIEELLAYNRKFVEEKRYEQYAASKYPNTAPIPSRDASGTAATAAKRNSTPASKKSEPSISGLLETADLPASHRRLWRGSPAPVRFAVSPSK